MTILERDGTSTKVLDAPAGLRDSLIELESPVWVLLLLRMLGCLLDALELLLLSLVVVLVDFFSSVENECNANAGDIDMCMQNRGKRAKEKRFPVWDLRTETDKFDSFFPNINVR